MDSPFRFQRAMEVMVLAVGKTGTAYILEGLGIYSRKLSHYMRVALKELPDVKTSAKVNVNVQKDTEGKSIIEQLRPSDYVVLLDENGQEYTSVEFARQIERLAVSGKKRVVFVIGGPFGFSESVYSRANAKISLSRMTFNHEMVRLFFMEQLYRAMTIVKGEPYHHA